MNGTDMAPFTAWLPARPTQDYDLIVKIVGVGAGTLFKGWAPIAQYLADQGLAAMAQYGRLNGEYGDLVLHVRIATQSFSSMGYGCDVLVLLEDSRPELRQFHLQPGSVLLWESPTELPREMTLPERVIVYQIPGGKFDRELSEGLLGRGARALGALLQILGMPEESLHRLTPSLTAPQSFMSGWNYASSAITKRDAYSLSCSSIPDAPVRMPLTPHQAIMLGYAVSSCDCRASCDRELVASPAKWTATHLGLAGAMVSVLESEGHPGVQAYRGPKGKVMALLRGDDSSIASCLAGLASPRVFVAADIPDVFKLIVAGHELVQGGMSDGVGVLIEETVALRQQNVDLRALVDVIHHRKTFVPDTGRPHQADAVATMAEWDEHDRTEVGFVAWGAAQGVVRDAVALCRSFGLQTAAFYPKRIVPFAMGEMESFAKTVDRVVIVESGQTQGCWDRLRPSFSFESAILTPSPGKLLTPMDIFLREGLGAV